MSLPFQFSREAALKELSPDSCVIIGIYNNQQFTPSGENLNQKSQDFLKHVAEQNNLLQKPGDTLFVPKAPGINGKILMVACGDANAAMDSRTFRQLLQKTAKALKAIPAKTIYCLLPGELRIAAALSSHNSAQLYYPESFLNIASSPAEADTAWQLYQAATILALEYYEFNPVAPIARKNKPQTFLMPEKFVFIAPQNSQHDIALDQAYALVAGMTVIKNLGNLPANICTPAYLAEEAVRLSKKHPQIKTEILEREHMAKLGMHSLLSVSQASPLPPKFIIMNYEGAANTQAPLVFIGKGITFDTGGTSIKPSVNMDEMKYDMCGAATVFGLMKTAALLKLPLNIIGLVPSAENMPGSHATRPGDIVTSMSGQTIEILNTDAEGRLILCDALTYAERFNPKLVIDMATLTGAIIMTFDHIASGVMGNNAQLVRDLLSAATDSGDKAWPLPVWPEYQEMLASNFADIPNIAVHNNAKSIIAACFLSRFAEKFPWAHLDIAGSAFQGGKEKGATGRPLPLLLSFLLHST